MSLIGAHIKVQKRAGGLLPFEHHGIISGVVKRGKEARIRVIHFMRRGEKRVVAETDLDAFLKGKVDQTLEVVKHPDVPEKKRFTVRQVLARARSQINSGGYGVVKKNCEHFAEWCHTNTWLRSRQVRAVGEVVFVAGVATMALMFLRKLFSGAR